MERVAERIRIHRVKDAAREERREALGQGQVLDKYEQCVVEFYKKYDTPEKLAELNESIKEINGLKKNAAKGWDTPQAALEAYNAVRPMEKEIESFRKSLQKDQLGPPLQADGGRDIFPMDAAEIKQAALVRYQNGPAVKRYEATLASPPDPLGKQSEKKRHKDGVPD